MPLAEFTPAIDDVGAILRTRTRLAGGQEAGTFLPAAAVPTTTPTAEQVTGLITDAVADLGAALGPDIPNAPGADPTAYRNAAKRLAALGAALGVELTYFPEQVATNRSPYPQLLERYNARRKTLLEAIVEVGGGSGGGESVHGGAGSPSAGGFPLTGIGMEFPW